MLPKIVGDGHKKMIEIRPLNRPKISIIFWCIRAYKPDFSFVDS